jgi:hypothetical protein
MKSKSHNNSEQDYVGSCGFIVVLVCFCLPLGKAKDTARAQAERFSRPDGGAFDVYEKQMVQVCQTEWSGCHYR